MDYKKIYEALIEKAKVQVLPENTYIEKHHILMRSLGGSNDKNNIVKLTARQHYIAHLLLYKIYKQQSLEGKDKTPYYKSLKALTSMVQFPASKDENGIAKRLFKFGSKIYETWKKDLANYSSQYLSGKNASQFGKNAYYSKELDQLKYFLSSNIIPEGFELGNPYANVKPTLNTHWFYNIETKQQKCLTDDEYEQYDKNIWHKGKCPEKQNYIRYNPSLGTKCMYNEQLQKTKHVKKEEIQKYLDEGWKLGAIYNWKKFKK